jgi:hypothetical protein
MPFTNEHAVFFKERWREIRADLKKSFSAGQRILQAVFQIYRSASTRFLLD